MKELPATLLLAPTGFSTLATRIWNSTSEGFLGRSAGPALALVLLSSVPMAILLTRSQRQGARRIGADGRDQPAENAKQDVPSEVRLTR